MEFKFRQDDPAQPEYQAALSSMNINEVISTARRLDSAAIAAGTGLDAPLYYAASAQLFVRAQELLPPGQQKGWGFPSREQ